MPLPRPFHPVSALLLAACPASPPAPAPPPVSSPAPLVVTAAPAPHPALVSPTAAAPSASPPASDPPSVDLVHTLFPDASTTPPAVAACLPVKEARARARCLIAARFDGDPEAARFAADLYESSGTVAGVQVDQWMDGGFRGRLHLVPEVPIGRYRRHLQWIAAATADFTAFFARISAPRPIRYRIAPLGFRFFRSVGRTTPSAYAEGWDVSYNVSGSLLHSADGVRETLFHEIFHLNDADHGDWSSTHLRAVFDSIVARCGTRVACLRPYAPGQTMVRGGTYYAFQPGNGDAVHEYAAELALRWYQEERAVERGEPPRRPAFKCGPEENRRAWAAIVAEFFGGADAVPECR